jgi:hypothetical protein
LNRSGATFDQCVFENNAATNSPGALDLHSSHPIIDRCQFVNNRGSSGGAIESDIESTFVLRKIAPSPITSRQTKVAVCICPPDGR